MLVFLPRYPVFDVYKTSSGKLSLFGQLIVTWLEKTVNCSDNDRNRQRLKMTHVTSGLLSFIRNRFPIIESIWIRVNTLLHRTLKIAK